MRLGDPRHDREPEPGAAAGAGPVRAREALEGALDEVRGEAGPLVPDVELDAAAAPSGADAQLARAVTQRVLKEVAERLFELQLVAAHPQALAALHLHRHPGGGEARAEARGHRAEQLSDLDLLAPRRELAAIEARDHQQVLREPHQPLRLLRGGLEGRAQLLGGASAPQRQLQLGLENAERRAQLVARVRGEAPLAQGRRLEAVQQLVQGLAQACDLVARIRHGQALANLGRRDRRRPAAHRLHRPQGSRGHAVAGKRRQHQGHQPAGSEQHGERAQGVVALAERGAHHHDPPSRRRGHRQGAHAKRPVDPLDRRVLQDHARTGRPIEL